MPYVRKMMSMIIILPDDIEDDTTGLEKVGHIYSYREQMNNFKQTD